MRNRVAWTDMTQGSDNSRLKPIQMESTAVGGNRLGEVKLQR